MHPPYVFSMSHESWQLSATAILSKLTLRSDIRHYWFGILESLSHLLAAWSFHLIGYVVTSSQDMRIFHTCCTLNSSRCVYISCGPITYWLANTMHDWGHRPSWSYHSERRQSIGGIPYFFFFPVPIFAQRFPSSIHSLFFFNPLWFLGGVSQVEATLISSLGILFA